MNDCLNIFAGRTARRSLPLLLALLCLAWPAAAKEWADFKPPADQANGKRIVLLAGDEEYRSEESMPMLAKILSQRHGFNCTVLFSQNPLTGTIDPVNQTNVPGFHLLADADLVICAFRFRELPDADMQRLQDYLQQGKPIIALRTATHSFAYSRNPKSPFARWSWNSKEWPGGFGQQVLGETWINHHGNHGKESTMGLLDGSQVKHPVLRGVGSFWGPSDVYGIVNLKPADTILVHGLTLSGMKPGDPPNYAKPLMPLVWVRDYTWENGKTTRALTSTHGAAVDLADESLRRLMVNASYWLTGLNPPTKADVAYVGEFKPSFFGFGSFTPNLKPEDHELK
jgi:type 1 glutamine amidotransferase